MSPKGKDMNLTRDDLVARLVKAGELEVMGGDQVETDSYFDTEQFRSRNRRFRDGLWRAHNLL